MKKSFLFLLVLTAVNTLVYSQDKRSDPQTESVLLVSATATGALGISSTMVHMHIQNQTAKLSPWSIPKTFSSHWSNGEGYGPIEQAKIDEVARANNSMARELVLKAYPTTKEGAKQLAVLEAEERYMRSISWADKKALDEITKRIADLKSGKLLAPDMKYYEITLKGEMGAAQTLKKLNFISKNTSVINIEVIQNVHGMGKLSDRFLYTGFISSMAAAATMGTLLYETFTSGGLSRFLGINDKANNENRLTGKPVENKLSNQNIETKVAGQ